jgi:2-aminoadipate transaminase
VRLDRLQKLAAARQDVIGLSGGLPATSLIPDEELVGGFRAAVREPDAVWQYGWCEGDAALRRWIASDLRRRGAAVDEEDVVITAGAQQALALATAELCDGGTRVAVDETSYAAALDLLRLRGAALVTAERERARADVRYVMPGVATPTGVEGVPDPDAALAGEARVIVDEAYVQLRFDGRVAAPLVARDRERVWHVGTVSKVLCPGLRVGWLVPPRDRVAAVRDRKQATDLQTGSLAQIVLSRALERLDLDAHVEHLRAAYAARAGAMLDALRRHAPSWSYAEPEGGFAIFVETPARGDEVALLRAAIGAGVSFDPGRLFRAEPDADDRIRFRLCFSSAPIDQIGEGVRRLAAIWEHWARDAAA